MTVPGGDDGFRMAGAYVEVSLKDNTEADEQKIRDRIEAGDPAKLRVELDSKSLDDVEAKVKARTKVIGDSSKVTTKIELDPGSVAAFEAKVKAIIDAASRSSTVSAGIDTSSGSGATASGGGFGGGGGVAALIAGGIGLGAGAIGGAALLSIPAVFTAIGVAAEKSNADVAGAFSGMETAAKQSLAAGFSPFVPTLVGIANEAKTAVTGMEPDFASAAQAASPLLRTVSTGLLQAVQEGVGGSIPIIQRLQPAADAAGQGFVQLERGVTGFLGNLDMDQSAAGFTALFGAIEQILPAAGSLLSAVMPLGNALLTVLGPAVRDTLSDLSDLRPVIQLVGSALTALSPDISLYGPILLGVMGASKLLTGSWLDLAGMGTKLKSVFLDANGEFDKGKSTLDSLAKTIGITTDSAKQAAIADAQMAADKAALADATAKQTLIQAQSAAAASDTAKTRVALAEAETAEAATAKAATAAQASLAEAETASTFAMGPLGAAIAGVGLLLLPFIGNMMSSSDATNKMAGELGKLQQAASDTQSLANLFKTDPQAEQQLTMLQKYGVTLKDLADANNGGAAAQQKVAAAAREATEATEAKLALDQKTLANVGAISRSTDAVNADNNAWNIANQTYQDAQAQLDATTKAQQAQSAAAQQSVANNGLAASSASMLGNNYLQAADALSAFAGANSKASIGDMFVAITQDAVASGDALQTVTDHFNQTAQAARSAAQSYQDSLHSEAQASQAVTTAREGVATAERSVADAIANVGIAQNNETKAVVAAQQAQVNLNTARATAIEQLKTLHLQLADQVVAEDQAQLKLEQQIAASAALGVTQANAAQIAAQAGGESTAAQQAQEQAAIDLLGAMNSVNDTLNTGANLRKQVAQSDQDGVENAPAVVSAKQALASANDQVTSAQQALVKANQAVSDADANVLKSEQGVKDALYNEETAARAAAQAFQAMTTAQAANSNTLDLNTAAGRANAVMQANAAQQILNSHEPLTQQLADLEALGNKFNDNQQMVNLFTEKLFALSGVGVTFDVHGVATIDMTQLEQSLYPGSTPASISADLKDLARGGSAMFHAEGGPIDGIGGPKDDLNLAFLSRGEWVQPVDSVDYYGTPFMEAIRQKRIPKEAIQHFAGGGAVGANNADIATLMLSGYDGAIGSGYEIGGHLKAIFGFPFTDLPAPVPSSGTSLIGGAPGVPASRAANEAAVRSVFSGYGWGSGPEWDATTRLIMMESGFNNTAQNPTSSAYGIFQFLDSTWGGYGISKTSDPTMQSVGGARYIRARYGDPLGALAHENAYHWYDEGGYVPPGFSGVHNATQRPEMMLPPRLGDTLEHINTAVQGGAGSAAPAVTHYNTWNVSTQDPYVAARLVAAQQAWNNMIGARA